MIQKQTGIKTIFDFIDLNSIRFNLILIQLPTNIFHSFHHFSPVINTHSPHMAFRYTKYTPSAHRSFRFQSRNHIFHYVRTTLASSSPLRHTSSIQCLTTFFHISRTHPSSPNHKSRVEQTHTEYIHTLCTFGSRFKRLFTVEVQRPQRTVSQNSRRKNPFFFIFVLMECDL